MELSFARIALMFSTAVAPILVMLIHWLLTRKRDEPRGFEVLPPKEE